LAPFVEQARAKAKAKAKAILAAWVAAGDELSDSDDEVRARQPVRGSPAPASPVQAASSGGVACEILYIKVWHGTVLAKYYSNSIREVPE
jgi:hypothetical protein